jgi:hypothetical protein
VITSFRPGRDRREHDALQGATGLCRGAPGVRLGIRPVRIGKRIVMPCFSLSPCGSRKIALPNHPHTPALWGWLGSKAAAGGQGKTEEKMKVASK